MTATTAALGEVEDEGLLASVFRDRFPEAQWREQPDVGRYLGVELLGAATRAGAPGQGASTACHVISKLRS